MAYDQCCSVVTKVGDDRDLRLHHRSHSNSLNRFVVPTSRGYDCSVWIRLWPSLVPRHLSPSFRKFNSFSHLELACSLSFSHLDARTRQPSLIMMHRPFTTVLSAALPRACSLATHVVLSPGREFSPCSVIQYYSAMDKGAVMPYQFLV